MTNSLNALILFFVLLLSIIVIVFFSSTVIFQNKNKDKTKENFLAEKEINNKIKPKVPNWEEKKNTLIHATEKNLEYYKRKYFTSVKCQDHSKKPIKKEHILVSIASYRDSQCLDTVRNLAEYADKPENLHFVICQQNNVLDKDCANWCGDLKYKNHKACQQSRITILRLKDTEARGPTWARFLIQQEYDGEEYFCQIDAHTRMIHSWDTTLKTQLDLCPNPTKSILTQLPCEYDIVQESDRGQKGKENWRQDLLRGGMYVEYFDDNDLFMRMQSVYTKEIRRQPFPCTCWVAGFSFSKYPFVLEVPYDPFLPFLFFGEEMDITLRAFTHGFDFFAPTLSIVFHNYKRNHRKTFWEQKDQYSCELLSRFRLYCKFRYIDPHELLPEEYHFILTNIKRWSLGNERTLTEYEKFAKINFSTLSKSNNTK